MAKIQFLIIPLILIYSCGSNKESENENSSFYPDTMSLWKVIDGPEKDDKLYFFFPNDSLILQYELRTWMGYSESGERDIEMSDFKSNHIYIKQDTYYMHHHVYWKRFAQFSFTELDSRIKMDLDDRSNNYNGTYTLEKFDQFDSLPSDPRKNWLSYYHETFSDTLVRFTSENPVNYIIFSHRGVDIDSLELEPYYDSVYYRTPQHSDTFFVAKGTDRIFVVSKNDTNNEIVLSRKGSFEVSVINRKDSLFWVALTEKIKSYEDSVNAR